MIVEKDGRSRSIRTAEEDIEALQKEMESLSPAEREAFQLILDEFQHPPPDPSTSLLHYLNASEYKTTPVDMRTFIQDPYFLGNTCDNLYPKLLDDLIELFEGGYHEVIYTGCIELDALVQSANGSLRTIREWIGDAGEVVGFREDGPAYAKTGVAKHSGTLPVVSLELANGMKQRLTPDHKVMAWREHYEWTPAGELVPGDFVVIARMLPIKSDSTLSEDEAKLLAYWCADGSSSEQRSRFCDGNPATSKEVVELLKNLGFAGKREPKGENCWEVYVEEHKRSGFLAWLRSHDAHLPTKDVVVPDAVCRGNNGIISSFLNRLWAAEGTVYANAAKSPPRFMLGMTSERFVRQVQLLLLRHGIASRLQFTPQHDKRSGKTTESWILSVQGVGPLTRFCAFVGPILGKEEAYQKILSYVLSTKENTNVDIIPVKRKWLSEEMTRRGLVRAASSRWWSLARGTGVYLSRRMFEEWLQEYGDSPLGLELVARFPREYAFERVEDLSPAGEAEVGDICDVEKIHSFISNGIYSHNSIGWGKCVHGSTEIFDPVSGRRRRVDELGDLHVVSMTEVGKIETRPATAFASGQKKCLEIRLAAGQKILLSADHKVFTARGWVEARDLVLEDLVATPRAVPAPVPAGTCVHTDDEVKLCAYLMADGGCTAGITFTNETEIVLEEFVEVVGRTGKTRKGLEPHAVPAKHQHAGKATTLHVRGVSDLVQQWGINDTSREKRLPAEFYGLSRDHVRLFLNRFWACDGSLSVAAPQKAEVTLASEGLINDLAFLLLRLGIPSRKVTKEKFYRTPDGTKKVFPAWCLTVTGADNLLLFLEEVGPILGKEAACAALQDACSSIKPNTNTDVVPVGLVELRCIRAQLGDQGTNLTSRFPCPEGQLLSRSKFERLCATFDYRGSLAWLATNDLRWERLVSIEDVGMHDVYDLSVPETHSFVGNGIVVHNTFTASIGIARILYELSCLKDPHKTYGLAKDTNISIVCLSGDTEFYEGQSGRRVRFSEAKGGGCSVVGFDGRSVLAARSEGVIATGRREIFRIQTSTGREIKATADHKFLTLDRGWVTVAELEVGHPLALAARLPEPCGPRRLSDAELRLLGYLVSEGNTTTKHVQFGNTDLRLIDEYVADAKTVGCHDMTVSVSVDTREGRKTYYNARERTGKRGQRNVRYVLETLCVEHDLFGKGSSEKRIPVAVMQESNEHLALFLNRLFAGDGSCHMRARPEGKSLTFQFRYATTSHSLAKDVADALARFGIFASIRRTTPSNGWSPAYYVDFSRKEYVQIFLSKIGIFGRESSYERHVWSGFAVATGDVCWDEITSIASVGEEDTYCIKNVAGHPWFVANGFVTHNCLSVNEMLATKVVFENISIKIKASPYFQESFPFEATKKELRFPNNIWVAARATTDTSALGLNTISALVDETNFMATKASSARNASLGAYVDHAEVIYNAIKRRMKSRFEKKGKLPGMLFIVSSKKTSDDFTARRVRESQNDASVFVRDYALWDVKQENFSQQKFWVIVGNDQTPSRILTDEAEAVRITPTLPEGVVLIDVPEDFRPDFERDLEGAIRDLAGCATVAISPFIQRREKILQAVDPVRNHPFSVQTFDPSKPAGFLWEYMVKSTQERDLSGSMVTALRPIVNPTAARHIHIDPSLRGDSTGFVMSHICGWKDVRRRSDDGTEYLERAPLYFVDFMLQIVPPIGDEIILGDVRRLVYDLTAHGYMITSVTMDSWQSADAIQQLSQRGYNSGLVSMDTSMDPYENLKTALYENRVVFYHYPPLLRELQQLERDTKRRKVDHPPRGCFVGSTRIPLLDGTFPTIEDLVGRDVWVYSSRADGTIVPGKARGRFTREAAELVDVILDSGAVERCTPEHRWRLRDGSYKPAQDLRPGIDRLMPVARQWPVNGGEVHPGNNHKVRAVLPVHLDVPVPVFDLEVDEHANFALASGVFVHNSKDVADALAGSLYTLSQQRSTQPLPILRGSAYYGDAWMNEQRQSLSSSASANQDIRGDMPLPILGGSGGHGGEGW